MTSVSFTSSLVQKLMEGHAKNALFGAFQHNFHCIFLSGKHKPDAQSCPIWERITLQLENGYNLYCKKFWHQPDLRKDWIVSWSVCISALAAFWHWPPHRRTPQFQSFSAVIQSGQSVSLDTFISVAFWTLIVCVVLSDTRLLKPVVSRATVHC